MTLLLKIIYFLNVRKVYSLAYHLLKFKYHTYFSANESTTHFSETAYYQKPDKETMNKLYIRLGGQQLGEKRQDHTIKGFKHLKNMCRAR